MVAQLMTPLVSKFVVKGVEADMDAVKVYCETNVRKSGAWVPRCFGVV